MRYILLLACLCRPFSVCTAQEEPSPRKSIQAPQSTSTTESATKDFLKEILSATGEIESLSDKEQSDATRSLSSIQQIRQYISARDWRNASQCAENANQNMQSDRFRKLWYGFAESLGKAANQQRESAIPQTKDILTTLPKSLSEAKSSEQVSLLHSTLRRIQYETQTLQRTSNRREELSETMEQLGNAVQFTKRYQQFLISWEANDEKTCLQIAAELGRGSNFDPRWRNAIRPVLDEAVNKNAENWQARFAELAKRSQAAKKSDEIAKVLGELQVFMLQSNDGSFYRIPGQEHLHSRQNQLMHWQEVLRLQEEGLFRSALVRLASMQSNGSDGGLTNPFVTSDLVIAKRLELQDAIAQRGDKIVDPTIRSKVERLNAVKDLDSLRKVISQLENERVQMHTFGPPEDQLAIDELERAIREANVLLAMQDAFDQRNWDKFWMGAQNHFFSFEKMNHRWFKMFQGLRMELIRNALVANKEYADLKLPGQEPLDTELLAFAESLIKANDYRRAYLFLLLYQRVIYPSTSPPWLTTDLTALQALAQASSYDAAGDTLEAARRYRTVIQFPSTRIPIESVQNRLKDLLAKHPELLHELPAAAPPPSASARVKKIDSDGNPLK